jgi:transcriptional regulator with XRE-family HTH domain
MSDFRKLWNDPKFSTPERKAKIELEVEIIGKLIEAREKQGITQEQLAEMSGLKQPAIARIEKMGAVPQIETLLKVLNPLGYTLAIVPTQQAVKQ